MFYKPKFCCNCGEKIERVDWRLWTSRRFCAVCAIENQGFELIPRVVVGIAVLFGVFGAGSYFQNRTPEAAKAGRNLSEISVAKKPLVSDSKPLADPTSTDANKGEVDTTDLRKAVSPAIESPVVAISKEQPRIRKAASDQPVYFCGAMTKKGTPCSRRVKISNERCWQHVGQPLAVASR